MEDTAAFKFDTLPGITFVVTRETAPKDTPHGVRPAGWLQFVPHRDTPDESLGESGSVGPSGPPSIDKPFVPGGKVPFTFRSLPGVTFYASRTVQGTQATTPYGEERVNEGWIKITYYLDGNDEEQELGGWAGPTD